MKPANRLIRIASLLLLLALPWILLRWLLPDWSKLAMSIWLVPLVLVGCIILIDAWLGRRLPALEAERILPRALSLKQPHRIQLHFSSPLAKPEHILVADHHPADDMHTGLPRQLTCIPGQVQSLTYSYRPAQRGTARFGDIEVWRTSPLGMWQLRRYIQAACEIPVYPDFSIISSHLDIHQQHLHETGIRIQQRRGEGMEFHQLRDYRTGDSMRQIDWKATARRRKLISREYQDEENQPVVMLLDGGLRMQSRCAGLLHFDHALNAALLLAWYAQKEGDRPAAMLFSHEQERWLPPQRGSTSMNRLLNQFYDLQPGYQISDYSSAARQLIQKHRKRSLVVILSSLHEEDEQELLQSTQLLGKHHLVMFADLLPPQLDQWQQQPVEEFGQALHVAVNNHNHQNRQRLLNKLAARGVLCVSGTAQHLPVLLSQRYLELKRAGVL